MLGLILYLLTGVIMFIFFHGVYDLIKLLLKRLFQKKKNIIINNYDTSNELPKENNKGE